MDNTLALIKNDPWLKPYEAGIVRRHKQVLEKETELCANESLSSFSNGHHFFGLHKQKDSWIIREWAPNATAIFLKGEFSGWEEKDEFLFSRKDNDVWELELPENTLEHKMLYQLSMHWEGGKADRISAWANRVVQDEESLVFNAQVWDPPKAYKWKINDFVPAFKEPVIYEAHVGMGVEEEKVGSYEEFRKNVLPHVIRSGYNTLQLMAIMEHPYYGSFGYHVSNFFAASSRFGTPEELKALVDEAHGAGLAVIMDLVHSHSVKNEIEGLARFDGTVYQFFHDGPRGEHPAWDSLCFNYSKNEVLHFLLSNCKYWLDEYKFDGFRFDGVTSMLYLDHGLSRDFTSYDDYFEGGDDGDAIVYMGLANKLIKEVRPTAISIAEEMSGMPGLAADFEAGGLGFTHRLAMGTPDYWIKMIKEVPDEQWQVENIYFELSNHRADEKSIAYCESHDQALVGDQTIIFRLIDKEMYFSMNKESPSLVVDRGMSLHKMIRLITLATNGGGYLTFMGNEFGHPEWIDFPREGNNWSYQYARRQWSLVKNKDLRYHQLYDFDRDMLNIIGDSKLFEDDFPYKWHAANEDQVLAFSRGDLLFVFNFNPSASFSDYGIMVPTGKYRLVLSTDSPGYGGFGNIQESQLLFTRNLNGPTGKTGQLLLYLPSRTAMVLKKEKTRSFK